MPGPSSTWSKRPESGHERFVELIERSLWLCQEFPDDLAADVGEPEVAPLEAVGQPGGVEAEQGEDRGVQVGHVDAVLDGVEAEAVGAAEGQARLDAAAGQPHREAVGVMVAA